MQIETEQQTPAPQTTPPPTPTTPVATVQPATVNYIVVGMVCLVIGAIIGMVITQRSSPVSDVDAIINRAVATAVAAVPRTAAASVDNDQGLDPSSTYTVSTDGDPFLGPEDAPITIIEFGDFRCGYCKRFHDETFDPLLAQYEGQVRYVFRDYPILSQESLLSAIAGTCAQDQGQFWQFHELMYANQNALNREQFISYATDLGMDVSAFTTCFDEQSHMDEIVQDYQDGQALGITGTPTFFINGTPLIGAQPIEQFQLQFDAVLAAANSGTTN